VTTQNFALTVFALRHKDINFEVQPANQQILVELRELSLNGTPC
jgi:hypothetical protein